MDPFTTIPAELRLQIFLSLQSKTTISSLIQASPIMLKGYLGYKSTITRNLLDRDFDDQMIQDAMGIILFPSLSEARRSNSLVQEHFKSWEARTFPNPLATRDAFLIVQIDKLHSLLMVFVEDYITKATAAFPPREYICLPQLTHSQSHLVFKGKAITRRLDSCNLSEGERRRLLRAFLRVELMSLLQKTPSFISYSLIKRLHIGLISGVKIRDQEAIQCVWVYTSSLYGAVFAHCADAWLPVAEATPEAGLLFPDNLFADPTQYGKDVGINGVEEGSAIESMAQYGFSLIFAIIRYAIARPQDTNTLESFVKKLCSFRMNSFLQNSFRRAISLGRFIPPNNMYYSTLNGGEGFHEQIWFKSLMDKLSPPHGRALQYKIFQQRAWPFFDNDRHYPKDTAMLPLFPPQHFLDRMEQERIDEITPLFGPGPVSNAQVQIKLREFRRAQKWQDKMRPMKENVSNIEPSLPRTSIANHEVSLPAIEKEEQLLTWSSRGVIQWDQSKEAYVLVKI
ncbi:hypothetical protein FMEXI_10131 [Fusarium mexicanum]|uniref:Uncharacterized protein n=1 Tax=Fusarium mexicanum TaxID=751941 RepID=A0A8H5MR31_9HYPO|nr:hypothetical protein FMEXI_10131 [Fusarium mexicanum]